jgi:phosphopantothenoylcysteine synthetase/decarboxylase
MSEQIPGIIFHPCFTSEEAFEEGMKTTEFWTESEFMSIYRKHLAALDIVASCAKVYILKNWEKVTDWTGLDVTITHGPSGEKTEYYNYIENRYTKRGKSSLDKIWKEIEEEARKKHNPIQRIENVVLDPTDGDFSLTVNEKEHWWIGNEEIIIIANYIEEKLKS